MLHVRRAITNAVKRISMEHMSSKYEDELARKLFIREGDCWDLGRTNSPTSSRRRDGHGYIRTWDS